jgi:serine acetyltransferase
VLGDVAENSVVVGTPARFLRSTRPAGPQSSNKNDGAS